MNLILVLFLLVTLVMILFFIFWQTLKYRTILPTTFRMLFLMFGYIIFPISFLFGSVDVTRVYPYSGQNISMRSIYLIVNILIFIFFVCFYFGYFLFKKKQYIILVNPYRRVSFFQYFIYIFILAIAAYFIYIYLYDILFYIINNISKF